MYHICIVGSESMGTINRNIFSHFSEHIGGVFYDGLWVGENSPVPNIRGLRKSIVESFKKINPPVLRWPGGCFAETYDWRDGIGPRSERPVTSNWWYRNDGRLESNQVGTHEFIDFCRLTGAQPYFAANITSTTPLEIRNWMEYCNYPKDSTTLAKHRGKNGDAEPLDVKYWGIGNENWGGGGNMTPEMYAREFIKYATICGSVNINDSKYIACGACGGDMNWTKGFMEEFKNRVPLYGLSFHYYCGGAGDPVKFTENEWYSLLSKAALMETFIKRQRSAMSAYDPENKIKIIVDEWGCWHPEGSGPSKGYNLFEQQSTMRDALVTAITLNIFCDNCDVVAMANVAQLCNNLHCLFFASGDKMTETPTYHVFDMYKRHQNSKQLRVVSDSEKINGYDNLHTVSYSASQAENGDIILTLVNLSYSEPAEISLSSFNGSLKGTAVVTTLSNADPHAHNTFENPKEVIPKSCIIQTGDEAVIEIPAASVTLIEFKCGRNN